MPAIFVVIVVSLVHLNLQAPVCNQDFAGMARSKSSPASVAFGTAGPRHHTPAL